MLITTAAKLCLILQHNSTNINNSNISSSIIPDLQLEEADFAREQNSCVSVTAGFVYINKAFYKVG